MLRREELRGGGGAHIVTSASHQHLARGQQGGGMDRADGAQIGDGDQEPVVGSYSSVEAK
ncbi:hypothetical protein OV287_06220 [Archangium sp. miwbw1]|uniref:Uncharacterized protein n=1 Tax=Archangium lansingense TaxID=2995310 RepID=A0ABT3ZXF1_9BACT|nr:hypothetical protein [Archangium lansinium]MCY1074075.1 hypothetical protein [Archangium lansinium]